MAAASFAAYAQEIDPTVEVSRVYEGKLMEVHKPSMEMAVPDTAYRFDLDFDYSVFDSPFRGSYEFNPYAMDMRPVTMQQNPSEFYLKAGAGYTLHPVCDLVWSPDLKGPFSADVYGMHRSYVGGYRALMGNDAFDGYDLLSKAGADFGYDWKKASLDFGASYYGIAVKDLFKSRSYNAADAYLSLKSKSLWPKHFMYGLKVAYRFAEDRAASMLREHDFTIDATFGPSLGENSRIFFDLGVEMDAYFSLFDALAGRFYFVPHYVYHKGILDVDLGLRLSAAVLKDRADMNRMNQIIYPDIRLDLTVIPDAMRLFVNVGGGEKISTYSSLLDENHHFDSSYAVGEAAGLIAPVVERVSAEAGLEGRISGFFSYNLRGGYVNYGYSPLDGIIRQGGACIPVLGYSDYQKAYAVLDWDLNFQSVRFDGNVTYTHAWGIGNEALFAPAAFTGDSELMYNWRKRIYAGVDCEFATSRSCASGLEVPGYADLGVSVEYVMNRKMSFWLRGGNLLNMEIQRNLLFAEKGIHFTAGICLNL